jgi:ankyrin repeat protein
MDFHDLRDIEGNTPLHIACMNYSYKVIYYLLGLTDQSQAKTFIN